MEKLDIEKFDPTTTEIQRIVNQGKGITVSDFTNKAQLKLVKEQRLKLRDIRVAIKKQGRMFRQEAIDFQRQVITKEKELIGLVEPEMKRLKDIEEKAEKEKIKAERVELLPKRKERLTTIGDDIEVPDSDDWLLDMDNPSFENYYNQRLADKNEKDRLALEKKQQAIKAEEERLEQEKEIRRREEKARKEEREKADRAEKERKDREKREAKEKIEREEKEKIEKEQAAKEAAEAKKREEREEKERLEKDKKYQKFLASHGWTKNKASEFHIEVVDEKHILYKKVGEIKL